MSGGHFGHREYVIDEIAEAIRTLVENNQSTERNAFGDPIGRDYPPLVMARFAEALEALRTAAVYVHRIDYLLSGDDGEGSFLRRLHEELIALERTRTKP